MVCSFVVYLLLNIDLKWTFYHCSLCDKKHWVLYFTQTRYSLRPMRLVYLGSAILHWQINVNINKMFGYSSCSEQEARLSSDASGLKCMTGWKKKISHKLKASPEAEDMAQRAGYHCTSIETQGPILDPHRVLWLCGMNPGTGEAATVHLK